MVEVGRRLGLGVEALDVGLVGELAGEDHLERDGAVEAHLPGPEDDAHAAAGDLADDLVVAEVADVRWCGGPSPGRCGCAKVNSGLRSGRQCRVVVDRGAGLARWPWRRCRTGRNCLGFGDGGPRRARLGRRVLAINFLVAQLALQGVELACQCGPSFLGDCAEKVFDSRLAPLPPLGLETPADLINTAGQLNVQGRVLSRA